MPFLQSWKSNPSPWPRMALAISLGFLILLVAFAILGEWLLEESIHRIREERLTIAQLVASEIDGVLEENIDGIQHRFNFNEYDPSVMRSSAEFEKLAYEQNQDEGSSEGIIFLDLQGDSILLHPPDLYPPGTDLRQFDYVIRAFHTQTVTFSEPYYDDANGKYLVAVAAPAYSRGNFIGVLLGAIDIRSQPIMSTLEQAAHLGTSGHASLFDRQGMSLASTYQLPFLTPGEHYTNYRRWMSLMKPAIETVQVEINIPGEVLGERHVMAFVPLSRAPWGVAVGGDEEAAFLGVRRLRFGIAILGAITIIVVWSATLLGTRRIIRPVRELTLAAQKIANGHLQTPLQISQRGEIGVMANSLEQMRLQLLSNIDQLSIWNETLEARVREKTLDLQKQQTFSEELLRRAITAQEEERARIARELHDEIGQTLTAVQLNIDRLEKSLPASQAGALRQLEQLRILLERALIDLRRVIAAMRPGVLDELGLVPALGWVVDQTLRPLGVDVDFEVGEFGERLPGEIETVLFRIAQEAIHNVARHSQAKHLKVKLHKETGNIVLALVDDGVGWDMEKASSGSGWRRGLGLASMKERASLVGAQVHVESSIGQGTVIRVNIPFPISSQTESLSKEETHDGKPI